MRNGIIATRRVVGSYSNNNIGEDIRRRRLQGTPPTFQKAVVVEVIIDPSLLSEDELQKLSERVDNPEVIDVMPINAVVAKIITAGQNMVNPRETILFPFFSSYIQLPVVPGEQIYVIYEDFTNLRTTIGYWITRISEQRTVEDINYTHGDRRYQSYLNIQNIGTDNRGQSDVITASFPNGGNSPETFTLQVTNSNGQNPYDGILEQSKYIKHFVFEPVPRFKKRPGDLVLQGKNNSMIVLGINREGSLSGSITEQAGTIDLVAGRARILPEGNSPSNDNQDSSGTSPWLINNSRGKREVNKAPYVYQGTPDKQNEGDPDFIQDASRIYITMQSEADISFGIVNNSQITYPSDTLVPYQPKFGVSGTLGKSYVVQKADNIRLIAKYNEEQAITGSILIIREGINEENMSYIYMDSDANMQLFAPKIYFGKSTGVDSNDGTPPEPYIKWSEHKKSLEMLQEEITDLKANMQSQIDNTINQLKSLTSMLQGAFASSLAVPYNPITSLVNVAGTVNTPATNAQNFSSNKSSQMDQKIEDIKTKLSQSIEDSKSQRIFGE